MDETRFNLITKQLKKQGIENFEILEIGPDIIGNGEWNVKFKIDGEVCIGATFLNEKNLLVFEW